MKINNEVTYNVAKKWFIKALEDAIKKFKNGYEIDQADKESWFEDFYSIIEPTFEQGKTYQVLRWKKPEETDYAYGYTVIADYNGRVALAMALDDHQFQDLTHSLLPTQDQPDWVIEIPNYKNVAGKIYYDNLPELVGDVSENKL